MRKLLTLLASLGVVASAALAESENPIEIDEWTVPYEDGRPRDPDAVSRSEVWFVGQKGDYLARLDPASGEFTRRKLEAGTGPHNLIVGSDGVVWYAGNLKGYIGRYDPETDKLRKIAMPDPAARDPHTLVFGADEQWIWFTVQGGNFIGRLEVADQTVELIRVPTQQARPYGITIAPDGTPWVALFATHKIASIDPETLEITEHELPEKGARPRRIAATSDGRLYFTDYARGALGRFDPKTGNVEEWTTPSGSGSLPYGMAVDAKDRVWFVETGPLPNRFVGFDPKTESFFSVTPISGGSVRHMDHHEESGTIWFGTDTNTIGRAHVGG